MRQYYWVFIVYCYECIGHYLLLLGYYGVLAGIFGWVYPDPLLFSTADEGERGVEVTVTVEGKGEGKADGEVRFSPSQSPSH